MLLSRYTNYQNGKYIYFNTNHYTKLFSTTIIIIYIHVYITIFKKIFKIKQKIPHRGIEPRPPR